MFAIDFDFSLEGLVEHGLAGLITVFFDAVASWLIALMEGFIEF